MNARTMVSNLSAAASRWAKCVPDLLRHDPLFRYASIAAVLAVLFLGARLVGDITGPGPIPPAGQGMNKSPAANGEGQTGADTDGSMSGAGPPAPGSAIEPPAPQGPALPTIAPGRSLEGLDMKPAPRDNFGTLPQKGPS